MSFPLNFAQRHNYDLRETGITVNAILRYGNEEFQCKAKVDTGTEYCLFSREVGEVLGIDIENGLKRNLGTLRGPLAAFGHELTLGTLGFFFDTTVYFAK